MIQITATCDKCAAQEVFDPTARLPSYRDWVTGFRKEWKLIRLEKVEYLLCKQCLKDFTKLKDDKEKEKKDEFFGP